MDYKDMNHSILQDMLDYEKIKDKLIVKPVNYDNFKSRIENNVHIKIGDMALVLHALVRNDDIINYLITVRINNTSLESWGKGREELIEEALINTSKIYNPMVYFGQTEINHPNRGKGDYMSENGRILNPAEMMFCTFTTYPETINGAISFWYPGVKEKIAEFAGGDYYVVFTGISEFHAHAVNMITVESLYKNLEGMNKYVNRDDELLTRYIYRYNHLSKELERVDSSRIVS